MEKIFLDCIDLIEASDHDVQGYVQDQNCDVNSH